MIVVLEDPVRAKNVSESKSSICDAGVRKEELDGVLGVRGGNQIVRMVHDLSSSIDVIM
ncbi:hypothetical protein BKA82DRAFT_1000349 [Pisolithus tinctorius]|uniref:Uncharacterized protein n=1 Tax=Pisolithus tinctorius Marx 270 TaxID=870435 RepID=A0A0C3PA92_PISTI|nr:hypothetical protein BKA82DRAFT_1000349 [Pisolithus tinctorius]KIO04806.1 hypothetical protein M404DRAFT_1000349 [Pisolithus tinctorius Marx 270]